MLSYILKPVSPVLNLALLGSFGRGQTTFLAKDDSVPINVNALMPEGRDISIEKCVAADPEKIFGDLPRLIRPDGVDDTDEVRTMCMQAFPELRYFPDQTANRRKLYMAIHKLRTESDRGWLIDTRVGQKPHGERYIPVLH